MALHSAYGAPSCLHTVKAAQRVDLETSSKLPVRARTAEVALETPNLHVSGV